MKPGTFTQLYVQLIFAVRDRENNLREKFRPRIFEYMSGIIIKMNHKSIIVNGISNHVHILIGLNPNISISDTVHDIKRVSSIFINNNKLLPGHFAWQEGYGAFSYSKNEIENVYDYILYQERHHIKQSFHEEYLEYLIKNEVEYNPQFLFEFFED